MSTNLCWCGQDERVTHAHNIGHTTQHTVPAVPMSSGEEYWRGRHDDKAIAYDLAVERANAAERERDRMAAEFAESSLTIAQTASDAVKAAHVERDEWRERALAAEGEVKDAQASERGVQEALQCCVDSENALRDRLDTALTLLDDLDIAARARCGMFANIQLSVRAFLAPAAGEPAKEGA